MEQFTQNDVENGTVHIDRCGQWNSSLRMMWNIFTDEFGKS